jgi:hypothetical protein
MLKFLKSMIDNVDFYLTCSRLAEMGEYEEIRKLMTSQETA